MKWNTSTDGTLWNNQHTAYLEIEPNDEGFAATASVNKRGATWYDQDEFLPVAEETFPTLAEAQAWLEQINERIERSLI